MPPLSNQQEAVCSFVCEEDGDLVVRARAGTGKTFTLLAALMRYAKKYPRRRICIAAFNRRIAKELREKTHSTAIYVLTLHGLGYQAIRAYWPRVKINNDRGYRLAQQACGEQSPEDMISLVRKLASVGKSCAPKIKARPSDLSIRPDHLDEMIALARQFDLEPGPGWDEDGWTTARVARLAQDAMYAALRDDGEIDFDDQVFVAVANGFAAPTYDLMVIDEAQDMNAAQLHLAWSLKKKRSQGGRLIVVGDDRQAIYKFRGADSGALDRIKSGLRAAELPLTITYRCARSIVDEARKLVGDYEAAPGAPAGLVREATFEELIEGAAPGDAILSRRNAELAGICMRLIKAGKRARIEGRDIGQALARIVSSLKVKHWEDFSARLESWRELELAKAGAKKSRSGEALDEINDQADTLLNLAVGAGSALALKYRIERLFTDAKGATERAIVCSSIHKAKGLEWDRVWLLDWTLGGSSDSADPMEEENLEYVAITRARRELVRVRRSRARRARARLANRHELTQQQGAQL